MIALQPDVTPHPLGPRSSLVRDRPGLDGPTLQRWLAVALVFSTALRLPLPLGVPFGFLVGMALIPITIGVVTRYRLVAMIVIACIVCAISGVLLTWAHLSDAGYDRAILITCTIRVLAVAVAMIGLLWAREILGSRPVVLTFGLGMLASVALVGVNPANPWKFSLSVPVILIVLGLPFVFGHRWREFSALLALTFVSAINDSRSAAAMLLIAAAIVLTQGGRGRRRRDVAVVLVQLVVIVIAGYFAVQAAILEGALGDAARDRTIAQAEVAGSALVGGRPEIGASVALVRENPFGIGAGTKVSYHNLLVAKEGMRAVGYDPNNNYVETYLFGDVYEVHSVIGNLWIQFGLAGLALAVLILVHVVFGVAWSAGRAAAHGAAVYLALRTLWDLPFSPFFTAASTLALALALTAVPVASSTTGRLDPDRRLSGTSRRSEPRAAAAPGRPRS